MTGQDFQNKLDAIIEDLQTSGKGQTIYFTYRIEDNTVGSLALSSDVNGIIDAGQLASVQSAIDAWKPLADTYETERAPVQIALDAFNTRRATHQVLIDAAAGARTALNDALLADAQYQTLKTSLETARTDAGYVAAVEAYKTQNVSENFGNLGDARGKYAA